MVLPLVEVTQFPQLIQLGEVTNCSFGSVTLTPIGQMLSRTELI